jgi:hypothetical protein
VLAHWGGVSVPKIFDRNIRNIHTDVYDERKCPISIGILLLVILAGGLSGGLLGKCLPRSVYPQPMVGRNLTKGNDDERDDGTVVEPEVARTARAVAS